MIRKLFFAALLLIFAGSTMAQTPIPLRYQPKQQSKQISAESMTQTADSKKIGSRDISDSLTVVGPLLTTHWKDGEYYDSCTRIRSGRHLSAGDLSVSMAQIMKYWEWPVTGRGSHAYGPGILALDRADFGATTYAWNQMPDALDSNSTSEQVFAVAQLIYHAAVSVETEFDMEGSWASICSYGMNTACAERAFKQYFKYSNNIRSISPDGISDEQYFAIIRSELDAGRPLLLGSYVCDGYDSYGLHIASFDEDENFYFIGAIDGWICYDVIREYMAGELVVGIEPDNTELAAQYTVTATGDNGGWVTGGVTFDAGSGTDLTAYAPEGYRFSHWNDNAPWNPRFVDVYDDVNLTAHFVPINANDTLQWDNGVAWGTINCDSICVTYDESLLAGHSQLTAAMFYSYGDNTTVLTVRMGENVVYADTVEVIRYGWHTMYLDSALTLGPGDLQITQWSSDSIFYGCPYGGGNDTIFSVMDEDTLLSFWTYPIRVIFDGFVKPHTLTLNCEPIMGMVSGDGVFAGDTTVTISATPRTSDFVFVEWSDGNTNNPRQLHLTSDSTLTAEFDYWWNHIPTYDFYLDLSVNDTTLGYLPDLNGWHPAYSSSGLGDVYISYYRERLIAAHPYANARFVDWNYYGDLSGIRTDTYRHDYISVNYDEGYEPEQDTLSIEAVFAPVRCGDTLLYDSGRDPSRAYYGTSDTATYYRWGVKFDSGTLGGITEIPMVEAYLSGGMTYTGYVSCTYTIQLWQGGNDSPQTQLHTQAYTISEYDSYPRWHGIIFNTPVAIDSTQPLWITISGTVPTYNTTNNRVLVPMFTSGYCGNPNSNYIWTSQTGWTHYNAGPGWDEFNPTANEHSYSWLIRAYSAVPTGVITRVAYANTAVPTEPGNDYVIGGGVYNVGESVTLTAVPDSGHCFKYWGWRNSDTPTADLQWVYDNPVTFTYSNSVIYTAYFSSTASLSIGCNDFGYGDVHGEGFTYGAANLAVGSTTTITATPYSNGIFRHWEWYYRCNPSVVYQVTENPYTFTVDGDALYTAIFEEYINRISVTANANNSAWGSVDGGNTYNQGWNVSLTASPTTGYYFSHWEWYYNDNPSNVHQSTNNPASFTATQDVTYTAIFAPMVRIITSTNWPPCNVIGGGYYIPGSNVSLTAEPDPGYYFTYWEWYFADNPSDVHQSTSNPISFTAERDAYYTAYFDGDITTTHITVHANNDNWGRVSGSGDYQTYETAILRAEPHDGYRFLYWGWDGFDMTFEDNPFALTLAPGMDSECSFTGYFESISGIDDNTDDDIVIYSLDGCIIVEGADGETVTIYDMTGRIVRDCGLPNGVYMVKVGDRTPRKVVLAR